MSILSEVPERLQDVELPDVFHGEDADLDAPPESLLSTGAAIAAAVATRKALKVLWKNAYGTEPPDTPTKAGVTWKDALLWAAAVGAAVGVARVIGQRGADVAAQRIAARRRR